MGLVGANGAGKSTSLRLLMDFIRPDKGEIRILDNPPSNHLIRQQIGYLPETAGFPPNLTVLDMLQFTGKSCNLKSHEIKTGAEKWLKQLDLWEARRRPLRHYSKGMQQRANFAIALLNEPNLLILDEPMSGLDPIGRANILSLIQELKKKGKTILFCSHILEDVDRLVDSVLVLHKGEQLYNGSLSDFIDQNQSGSFVDAYLKLIHTVEKDGE